MAPPFANLSGAPLMSASITIPFYGAWTADVVLTESSEIPSSVTLSIGSLSLVGSVFSMASFAGSSSARVVGGYGGWRNTLDKRTYFSAVGVLLSHVLGDAAIELGEKVDVGADRALGIRFIRANDLGSKLLRQVSAGLWYIDPAGTTQLRDRSTPTIKSDFQVIKWSGGRGLFEIATEAPADWMPGALFSAPTVTTVQQVQSVTHNVSNSGVARLTVLAEAA